MHEFFWPITVKMKCGHMADTECVSFARSAMISMNLTLEEKHDAMLECLEKRECSCCSTLRANP